MKQKKNQLRITPIGVVLVLLFLAACSTPPVPPQETQTIPTAQVPATGPAEPTATVEGSTATAGQGLCTNVYYPVQPGATWTYKSTGGPAGEYSFTDTITSIREDGFTLSTQIGDMTRTQEWTCSAEGLTALQLGGAPAAMLNSQEIEMSLDVSNVTGVTF